MPTNPMSRFIGSGDLPATAQGAGLAIAQGAKTLGACQTAFDAEVVAIKTVLEWFHQDDRSEAFQHVVIRTDSQSAIARAGHTGAGPRQAVAQETFQLVSENVQYNMDQGPQRGERADILAGKAAEKMSWFRITSLAHLCTPTHL